MCWDDASCKPNLLTLRSVVIVHGLYGERDTPWMNPGSGNSSWISDPKWGPKRVMSFGYDMRRILVGHQTRQAIHRQAVKLLNQLKAERENGDQVRKGMYLLKENYGD
jgi:hypothetical protein